MRVSVLIPNYNYGRFIGAAIESVLAQTEPAEEIIVVDDGSTDDSRQVIESFGTRITAIFQPNGGQASAISRAFAEAGGEIVALLDSDDVFARDKLRRIREAYRAHPEAGWVFHEVAHLPVESISGFLTQVAPAAGCRPVDQRAGMQRLGKSEYQSPATSGLTFRRALGAGIFPLPQADSIYISDHYIKYYFLAVSPGLHCPAALAAQTIHAGNLYTGKKAQAVKARIFLNTAVALLKVVPQARRFCHNLFTTGFAAACRHGVLGEMREPIRRYAAAVRPREWPLLLLRLLYQFRPGAR